MLFNFTINSSNAAFSGGGPREVARLLREAADEVEETPGSYYGNLYDANGNYCGSWEIDDERPDFEDGEAEDLFKIADDFAVALDDDPRKLSRAELVAGLESIGVACYDEESDELLAAAYGDSMLAGDLPGSADNWREALREAWEQ